MKIAMTKSKFLKIKKRTSKRENLIRKIFYFEAKKKQQKGIKKLLMLKYLTKQNE